MHRAATIGWESIPVDIYKIDIRSAQRVTTFQYSGAFVRQRVNGPFNNLFIRTRAANCAAFPGGTLDEVVNLRIGLSKSRFVISVPTGAGLLTKAAPCAEHLDHPRLPGGSSSANARDAKTHLD